MRFFTVSIGLAAAIASAAALTVESRGDNQDGHGHNDASGYGHHSDDNIHAHIHIHENDHARKGYGHGEEKKHNDGGYGDVHKRGDSYDKGYGYDKDHHPGKGYGERKNHDGGYGDIHKRGDSYGYGKKDHHRSGYGEYGRGKGFGEEKKYHNGGYGDAHKRDGGYRNGDGYGKASHRGVGHGYGPHSDHLRAYSRRANNGTSSPTIPPNNPISSNSSGSLFNSTAEPPNSRPAPDNSRGSNGSDGDNGPNDPATHSNSGSNVWPQCSHHCPDPVTQCKPTDWNCLCANQQWLNDNKQCFQQYCDHGNEYDKVRQILDRHCNRNPTPLAS